VIEIVTFIHAYTKLGRNRQREPRQATEKEE
jgi:hypothetical protein